MTRILSDEDREGIRDEVRDVLRGFTAELRDLTVAARDLSKGLFEISANQAQIKSAAQLANEAITIAASLRHEWVGAKALAKIFEQREFLGLPMVRQARARLLNSQGFSELGAGDAREYEDPELKKLREENKRLHVQLSEREKTIATLGGRALGLGPLNGTPLLPGGES